MMERSSAVLSQHASLKCTSGSPGRGIAFCSSAIAGALGRRCLRLRWRRAPTRQGLFAEPQRPCVRFQHCGHPVVELRGVVMMVKLRMRSSADERQVSHNPASAISPPRLSPTA
jgi:hypothetical protein